MAFARINGVLLHYRLAGPAGAPVVAFVNSLGTDLRIWDDVIAELQSTCRVLTYDKRGHGLSDSPVGDYALNDHVADLAGLLDHLEIGAASVCGVSIGGLIAQAFALAAPTRADALVLCDTAARFGDAAMWEARAAAIRVGGMAAIADGIMERWFSPDFFHRRPDDLAGWRNQFLRTDVAGYVSTCATLRDADLSVEVGRLGCPVQVVAGAEDRSTPVEVVRALADVIPGARFEVIAGAGHIPSIEQPAILARLVTRFLEEARNG